MKPGCPVLPADDSGALVSRLFVSFVLAGAEEVWSDHRRQSL